MVTPAVAVDALERLFPFTAKSATDDPHGGGKVAGNLAPQVVSVIAIIDSIPESLLELEGEDYATLLARLAELRFAIEQWRQHGETGAHIKFSAFRDLHDVMRKCPDRPRGKIAPDLAFLNDPELQADLARDVAEVNLALTDGEWKSATVLAGSIIEALLLWEHQQNPSRTGAAIPVAVASGVIGHPPPNLLEWTLHPCIEVAHAAGILSVRTTTLARLTKDYRNLIHPGRAARLALKPDRSTALAAAAAMEAVLKELRNLHP